MSLSESKIEMSCSDKKGLKLVNKESLVCDGGFVVPVPLSKVINDLLNNVFSARKRLMRLRKKVIGDDALIEFIKGSFIEMQENA